MLCLTIKHNLVAAMVAVSFILQCEVRAGETNPMALNSETNTNGIYVTGNDWVMPAGGHHISITIHFTPPNTNVVVSPWPHGPFYRHTNNMPMTQKHFRSGVYFMAANNSCGIMELRDAAGVQIPLLNPEVNSLAAFPDYYNLHSVTRLVTNVIAPFQLPIALNGNRPTISFRLEAYFKPEKSGVYQLTVWPKIYKRTTTNDDVCERIDLPLATIPIKWTGNSKN